MTEREVIALLAERYKAPAFAFMSHVRNGTGYERKTVRTADALAMGLWPSRGLELHGFEVKVSRSDFLHELEQPEKADEIARFCDRWWMVVADAKIVKDGELPATWGLLAVTGKRLVCVREATQLAPQPFDRLMLAAIIRRVHETHVHVDEVESTVQDRVAARGDHAVRSLEELQKAVAEFESESGLKITDKWGHGRNLGTAVNLVLGYRSPLKRELLNYHREEARKILAALDAVAAAAQDGVPSDE